MPPKPKPKAEVKSPKPAKHAITFTAYTVCKSKKSSNAAQAFEIKIVDGSVTAIKEISRAPDLPVSVIAKAVDHLWQCFRTQYTKDLLGEPQEPAQLS
jgi:hypothetical protein